MLVLRPPSLSVSGGRDRRSLSVSPAGEGSTHATLRPAAVLEGREFRGAPAVGARSVSGLASVGEGKGPVPALVVTLRLSGKRRGRSHVTWGCSLCSGGPCFPLEEPEAQRPG